MLIIFDIFAAAADGAHIDAAMMRSDDDAAAAIDNILFTMLMII